MLIRKQFTWHSLTYIVGITSSMAVHQVSPGTLCHVFTRVLLRLRQLLVRSPIARLRVTGCQLGKQSLRLMTMHLRRCHHKSRQTRNSKPTVSRQLMSLGAASQAPELTRTSRSPHMALIIGDVGGLRTKDQPFGISGGAISLRQLQQILRPVWAAAF